MRCNFSDARDCCECSERICRGRVTQDGYKLPDAEEPEEYDYE